MDKQFKQLKQFSMIVEFVYEKFWKVFEKQVNGKTKSIYNICKNIFLGGSLVNHGGQNPLEATRYGCNILHGPHISNFKEIYKFLKMKKISYQTNNELKTINKLYQLFKRKNSSLKKQRQLSLIGKKILNFTCKEIDLLL